VIPARSPTRIADDRTVQASSLSSASFRLTSGCALPPISPRIRSRSAMCKSATLYRTSMRPAPAPHHGPSRTSLETQTRAGLRVFPMLIAIAFRSPKVPAPPPLEHVAVRVGELTDCVRRAIASVPQLIEWKDWHGALLFAGGSTRSLSHRRPMGVVLGPVIGAAGASTTLTSLIPRWRRLRAGVGRTRRVPPVSVAAVVGFGGRVGPLNEPATAGARWRAGRSQWAPTIDHELDRVHGSVLS